MLRLIAIGLCLATTLLHSVGGCCWHHLQAVAAPSSMIAAPPPATCCCDAARQSTPVETPQPCDDEPVCHGDRCVYLTSPADGEWRPATSFFNTSAAPHSDSEHAPRTEEQAHGRHIVVTAEATLHVRLARLQLWII